MAARMPSDERRSAELGRSRRAQGQVVRACVYGGLATIDAAAVLVSFLVADVIRHGTLTDATNSPYLLIVPVFVATAFYLRCYSYAPVVSLRRGAIRISTALAVAVALTVIAIFALKTSEQLSRLAFFTGTMISLVVLTIIRFPLPGLVARLGSRFMRRILIVDGIYDGIVPPTFERYDMGAHGITPDTADPFMLHRFSQLASGADRVVVACPVEHRGSWTVYLKSVDCAGELLLPELKSIEMLHPDSRSGLFGVPVSSGSFDMQNRLLKRVFDLTLTVPIILLLSPLFTLVAVAIMIESGRPILFRQQRIGRANQLFNVLKFRSMYLDSNNIDGRLSVARNDTRVTRVGRLIRATSIDELPQLLNVIDGEMSLVGPRPHALGSLAGDQLFWHVDSRYWLRHAIKPGLTGLAQVRGFRGATDHRDDLANRLESDLDYMRNWTILRDVSILLRTIFVLIHNKAY